MSRASDMRAMRVVLERLEGVADRHPDLRKFFKVSDRTVKLAVELAAIGGHTAMVMEPLAAWVDLASSGWLSWVPGRGWVLHAEVMTGFAEQVFRAESKSA